MSRQWVWFVPHDIPGLVQLFGNNETFINILNEFIGDSRSPKDGGKWKYGTFLANGWYWAGNEPDLLAPWLFPFAGAQYLTAYWTRYLVNNVYTANGKSGLPGNDDYGTMSSWLIWGLIGFYPMAGTEQYIVGSPSFNNITINRKEEYGLSNIHIIAYNNTSVDNVYVKKLIVNGEIREVGGDEPFIYWNDLNRVNGEDVWLEFYMSDTFLEREE